jgi:hypothetical protein
MVYVVASPQRDSAGGVSAAMTLLLQESHNIVTCVTA